MMLDGILWTLGFEYVLGALAMALFLLVFDKPWRVTPKRRWHRLEFTVGVIVNVVIWPVPIASVIRHGV